ncbi:MAG: heavy metal-associated domain-containing protein, partial [Planctomycetota bacterium]|nr:heavy metal-associated domain-containing protein [Planctomycetota bacterium]
TTAPSATSTIANATTYVIGVQGMHCGGCANAIATKAGQVEGVASCDVSFENGTATVVVAPESIEEVESAITTLGYTITTPATPADAPSAG